MREGIGKDKQMKTCTSGNLCKHPEGPELPDSEFYNNGKGGLMVKCKACLTEKSKTRYQANKTRGIREIIKHLKTIDKDYWYGVLTDEYLVGKQGSEKHEKVFKWMIKQ